MREPASDPITGPTRRPGWFIPLTVVLAVLALAMAGTVVSSYMRDARTRIDPSATATIRGDVTLFRSVVNLDGVLCEGRDEFVDIRSGALVTVTDASGTIIALGRLGPGKLHGAGICQWQFAVPRVPHGKDSYGVKVANRPRVNYTEAELASAISLSFGN